MLLVGNQNPTQKVVQKYKQTDGMDACFLSENYGLKLDKWQADIINDWLAFDTSGKFIHKTCGLSVPRQNGKNSLLEARELFGIIMLGEKIAHTSHEVKTNRNAFLRLTSYFTNQRYPELQEQVKTIRYANGQEAIELLNGGEVRFIARSKSSGRGFTSDVIICDEAQILQTEAMESLVPTMSSAPLKNSQLILTGTPPTDYVKGEEFKRLRQSAKDKKLPNTCWHEWSVNEIGDISDKTRWAMCNPAYGMRIYDDVIERELASLTQDGFARERLGWWSNAKGQSVIPYALWEKLVNEKPPKEYEKLAYSICFSYNGEYVSLAVAIKEKLGEIIHVEHIDTKKTQDGISWLKDWIIKRKDKPNAIYIEGIQGESLYNELIAEGVSKRKLVRPKVKDIINAHSTFYSAVLECKLTHFNQQIINECIINAKKRAIGAQGGFAFAPINQKVPITPLVSIVLAYYGAKQAKQSAIKKQRLITL